MPLQPAGRQLRAGGLVEQPRQHRSLGRADHHQQDPLGGQDLGHSQGDRPGRHGSRIAAEGGGVLAAGGGAELDQPGGGSGGAGGLVEAHVAIEPQPQQLQADAAGGRQGGAVAAGFSDRIGRQPIGQPHLPGIEAQGLQQMAGHEGRKRVGIGGAQPHVFIEVETLPAGQQRLALGSAQGIQLGHQSRVHRLHRAPRGQAQGLAG